MSWQCVTSADLNWCHSVSKDFVRWTPLPPMFSIDGERAGRCSTFERHAIAIYNEIGGGGHWQARPVNISDPYLMEWHPTYPNGTECTDKSLCAVAEFPAQIFTEPFAAQRTGFGGSYRTAPTPEARWGRQ